MADTRRDTDASSSQAGPGAGTGHGTPRLLRSVVLVGMMGCGKTTVGTALSRLLSVPFLDSDEEIERAAQMSVSEIFARDGETFFRARETEILARILAGPPAIVSTGGGAFLSERNRALIEASGVAIWLQASPQILWSRVKGKTTRPLLRTANPRQTLETLLHEREPIYAKARLTVSAEPGLSVEAMARKVVEELHACDGILEKKNA